MSQLTIRADEELVARIKQTAAREGRSMNEWATLVLRAATDPEAAGTEIERIRERLRLAGVLTEHPGLLGTAPDHDLLRAAGERAASGRSVASYLEEDRGER